MKKWSEITANPDFQNESPEVKQEVARQYYAQLESDPNFVKETDEVKNQVRSQIGLMTEVEPALSAEDKQLQLFDKMYGNLPNYDLDPNNLPPYISKEFALTEPDRRKAYQELKDSGLNDIQIQTVLDIQKKIKPGVVESLKRNSGQMAGGIVGGIAGAKLATTVGQIPPFTALPEEGVTVPIGAAIGAFVGGGAGKSAQQAISPYESPSARDFINAGLEEGAYEFGGRLVSAGVKTLPIFKKPVSETGEAQKIFIKNGGFFTPAQRDRRLSVRTGEQLSRGSFGGGPIFKEFDKTQTGQAVEVANEIIRRIAKDSVKDPAVLGRELDNIFDLSGGSRYQLLDDFFEPIYKKVDSLSGSKLQDVIGDVEKTSSILDESGKPITQTVKEKVGEEFTGATVSTKELKEYARKNIQHNMSVLQTGEKERPILYTQQVLKHFDDILALKDKIGFSEMRNWRSKLLKDVRKMKIDSDQSEGMVKQISNIVNKAIFDPKATEGLPEEARKLLINANAVYGAAQELYDDAFIKSVSSALSESPSMVVKTVYKDMDYDRLKKIRDILVSPVPQQYGVGTSSRDVSKQFRALREEVAGTPAARLLSKNAAEGRAIWKQLNAAWFSDVVEKSLKKSADGTIEGVNVSELNKIINNIPEDTFKLMFPGEQGRAVKSQIKLFEQIAPRSGGISTLFGKGMEFTAGSGAAAAISSGSGIGVLANGAIAITPYAYARLATNPKATALLTVGFTATRGTVKTAPIAARLIELMNEDAEQERKEIQKEYMRKQMAEKAKSATPYSGFFR